MPKRLLLASVLLVAAVAYFWSDRTSTRSNSRAESLRENVRAPDAPSPPEPAVTRLSGRVVEDETDRAVAGATVVAYAFGSENLLETTCADDGAFVFPGAQGGAFEVVARHEGFGAASIRVVAPREPVVVRLPPAGGVRGRVVSAQDKAPVSPCRVMALRLPAEGEPRGLHASILRLIRPFALATDATAATVGDGTFRMEGLAPGPYLLYSEPEGPLAYGASRVEIRARETADARIEVLRAGEILVDVFDEETGRPLDGASFEMTLGSDWSAHAPLVVRAKGSGTYGLEAGLRQFATLPARFDMMSMRVGRPGYASREVLLCRMDPWDPFQPLRPGDRFRVALGRGATIDGHVWDEGKAAQGALVVVGPRWRGALATATGSDGAFEIQGIDVGEGIQILVFDRALRPLAALALVLRNGERRTLEIGAAGATAIEGRVALDGKPADGSFVTVTGATEAHGATDRDGLYRIEGLDAGSHAVSVNLPDVYIRRHVDVAAGQRVRLDIEPRCAIRGVVIDSRTSEPVTDSSYLGVIGRKAGSKDNTLVFAGKDGAFRLPVDPGFYEIDCQSEDVYAVEKPVADAAAGAEVVLHVSRNVRRGSIALDIRDDRTNEAVTDCVYEYANGSSSTRGSKRGVSGPATIPGLSPGVYSIRVWSDAHVPAEITVTLGEDGREACEIVSLRRSEALRITKVDRDSEAARVGLRAGDVIVALNGAATPSFAAYDAAVSAAKGTARIEYDRNGARSVTTVATEDLGLGLENILLGR